MKYLAAYILCVVGGNATPSAADVSKVVTSAGGECDEAALEILMNDVAGKDINELMAAGNFYILI